MRRLAYLAGKIQPKIGARNLTFHSRRTAAPPYNSSVRCSRHKANEQMESPDKLKRAFFLAAQIVLFAIAASCLYFAHNNFAIRSVGILSLFASLAILRRSRSLPASPEVRAMQSAWALKPWHWLVGLSLILTVAATFIWLQQDAATGGKSTVPVYAFAAAIVVSGGWWSALYARWSSRRRSQ